MLEVLHEPRFVDLAPAEVYATLLDDGRYLCSERTLYRVLAENAEVRERRDQLRHPSYAAPQLLATRPNDVWSWDITKLLGPTTWTYYYLYVLLDVFSRYVVGWLLAEQESARLAEQLIAASCERQGIAPGQLTMHSDRGPAMTSKPVALLLADLGVTKSHSRPHVSNDNPFSESQFKTLKYRPEFPDRFGSLEHGRNHCGDFFPWYNTEHHHVGLGLFTPHDVHYGLAEAKRAQRARVLAEAFARNPERFPNGRPQPKAVPSAVWINPPVNDVERSRAENTMTQESREVAIVDPGASCEAVLAANRPESSDLIPEDLCMAVAQQTHEASVSKSLTGSVLPGKRNMLRWRGMGPTPTTTSAAPGVKPTRMWTLPEVEWAGGHSSGRCGSPCGGPRRGGGLEIEQIDFSSLRPTV